MGNEEAYKDKKEFTCTGCGKLIMATKFASAKTIKCDECKANGIASDPNIVGSVVAKLPVARQGARMSDNIGGETKELPCIQCGKIATVSKFMSASKVLCDDCKGESSKDRLVETRLNIDLNRVDRTKMPPMEEYYILPSIISNERLRDVQCPACGTPSMRIIGIIDYSSFGNIIHYQCANCKDIMVVSEQAMRLVSPYKVGTMYDYSGEAIRDLVNPLQHTRMGTTIQVLINKLEENNITVEGIELPPFRFKAERPVPVGFEVDINDKAIKIINDAIMMLKSAKREGSLIDSPEGSRNITISDTLANKTMNSLKLLLKEEHYE